MTHSKLLKHSLSSGLSELRQLQQLKLLFCCLFCHNIIFLALAGLRWYQNANAGLQLSRCSLNYILKNQIHCLLGKAPCVIPACSISPLAAKKYLPLLLKIIKDQEQQIQIKKDSIQNACILSASLLILWSVKF